MYWRNNKKGTGLKRGLTLAFLGLAAIKAALVPATAAVASDGYYRYYYDEPWSLQLDLARVVIYQDPDADPPLPPLGSVLIVYGINPQTIRDIPMSGWAMAGMPDWVQNAADAELLVSDLADDEGLTFASPVFAGSELTTRIPTYHLIVRFYDNVPLEQQQQIIAASGAGVVVNQGYCGIENAWRLHNESGDGFAALAAANSLAEHPATECAVPDFIGVSRDHGLPDDTFFENQWAHLAWDAQEIDDYLYASQDIDMDTAEAWEITEGSAGIDVAIFDNGTQLTHPDLNMQTGVDIYANDGEWDGSGKPQRECDNHGTGVAGIIAGIINNGKGVAGVAPGCDIAPVRIRRGSIPCDGTSWSADSYMTSGLYWAYYNGYEITSHSYEWEQEWWIDVVFEACYNAGMLHFAASGNDGIAWLGYPASHCLVNAVGGIEPDGSRYGNYGGSEECGIQFVAPAKYTWSTDRTGDEGYEDSDDDYENYTLFGGTSAACPAVAGVAALVWSLDPSLDNDGVLEILRETTVKPKDPNELQTGWNNITGYGLVNAHKAVCMAAGYSSSANSPFIISEIRIHDPAGPDEEEYFELHNNSDDGKWLRWYSYAVIGDDDDTDSDGVIDSLVKFDLEDNVEAEGFWTVVKDEDGIEGVEDFSLGPWDEDVPLYFENGDNLTHMLLYGAYLHKNCDLDMNDDGVLDYRPWIEVVDSVAILQDDTDPDSSGATNNWWYADDTVGPTIGGYAPGHVYRCSTTGSWTTGNSDPDKGCDTPDAENPPCEVTTYAGLIQSPFESILEEDDNGVDIYGGEDGMIEYGVRVLTDEHAEYLISKLTDFVHTDPAIGAKIMARETGALNEYVDDVIIIIQHLSVIDTEILEVRAEFPYAETTLQDVTLFRGGEVVATYTGLDAPRFTASGVLEDSVILEPASHLATEPHPLEAVGTFTFATEVEIGLMSPGAPVTADQIEFRPSVPLNYQRVQYLDLIAKDTPSFRIEDEWCGKFGNAHRALGNALYEFGPNKLALEGLDDPEGADGVAIMLGHASRAVVDFASLPPIDSLPDGAFLSSGALSDDGGQTGSELGGVKMEAHWDGTASVTADFSALEASGIETIAYDSQEEIVGAKTFNQSVAIVAKISEWMARLGRGGWPEPADPSATLTYEWDEEVFIILGEGPQVVEACRLVIAPVGGQPVEALGKMSIRAGNGLHKFAITGETVEQVASDDCPGDINQDGKVDVDDLFLTLAAWGDCQGCPEDVNDDGTVDINDVFFILANWGPCL